MGIIKMRLRLTVRKQEENDKLIEALEAILGNNK